jgi:hypothetical protein
MCCHNFWPGQLKGYRVKQVVTENPVINSPDGEPSRHFKFDEIGITNDVAAIGRPSSYVVPMPRPRKTGGKSQQTFDEWRSDRIEENGLINRIRQRVQAWRSGRGDPLNLIIEVAGDRDRAKEAKVSTAKTRWVPAVNTAGQWGRWAIMEVDDPWAVKGEILMMMAADSAHGAALVRY